MNKWIELGYWEDKYTHQPHGDSVLDGVGGEMK